QKRRVADLLASAIPEDEALLLRSGRFACSVCPHRPVCDTLEALAVHRAGRKHLHSERLRRVPGRLQIWPQMCRCVWPGGRGGMGVASPDPCPCSQGCSQAPLLARTRWIAQNALLKSTPYSSCSWRAGQVGETRFPRNTPFPTFTPPFPSLSRHPEGCKERKIPKSQGVKPGAAPDPAAPPAPAQVSPAPGGVVGGISKFQPLSSPFPSIPSRGWIQDPSGKWMKDKNVEFDSDEEEPPALLPG
ncbi:SCNM1 protein, partial [Climacteris rufus]|nr:SCNM1 protein [Climacteris rufus]